MHVNIHLGKRNVKTLKALCKRLFTNYKKIIVSKKTVLFKKRWYSLHGISIPIVDLVLLDIPKAINNLYEEYELTVPFEYHENINDAVLYFGVKSIGEDFIQFLQYQVDNMNMSLVLNESYNPEPIRENPLELIEIKEHKELKKQFALEIEELFSLTDVLCKAFYHNKSQVYHHTESSCN